MAKKKNISSQISSVWFLSALLIGVILFGIYSNLGSMPAFFSKTTNKISKIIYPESTQSALINLKVKPVASPSASPTPTPVPINYSPAGSTGIPVLTYHYIGNNPNPKDKARDALEVTPDKFEEQMQYLSTNGFTPISLDTLYAIFANKAGRPAKAIVLTFDDGYIDFYTTAFPILKRYNFHAVSFIPTGLVGGGYYMNWSQIKEIQSSGLISFEAHTINHVNLAGLSYKDALRQMMDSKNVLTAQTGYPVNFMAYPYGINNNIVQNAAKEAGYLGAFGTWIGKSAGLGMNMPRIKVSGFWSISEFAARL